MLSKKNTVSLQEYQVSFLVLVCLFAIDMFTKYLFYDLGIGKDLYLLEPAMNFGISFSFQVPYMIVIPLSILALGGFFYLYHYKAFSTTITLLLMAGTLGNFYDRVVYSGVRDFIVMPGWFVYNVADIFLSLGMIIACIYMFAQKKRTLQ